MKLQNSAFWPLICFAIIRSSPCWFKVTDKIVDYALWRQNSREISPFHRCLNLTISFQKAIVGLGPIDEVGSKRPSRWSTTRNVAKMWAWQGCCANVRVPEEVVIRAASWSVCEGASLVRWCTNALTKVAELVSVGELPRRGTSSRYFSTCLALSANISVLYRLVLLILLFCISPAVQILC